MRVSNIWTVGNQSYYAPVACHIIRKNTSIPTYSYSKHKQKTVQHHEQENSKLMIISANTK